jgi:NADPH:quinone reductase-like Zn-dependent oxidoreductase
MTALHAVPDGVGIESAAQFSLNPITAWALLDEIEAGQSDWIAVTAGRSAVSRLVGALARGRGLNVVGVARGPDRGSGAFPLVGDGSDLAVALRDVTEGRPLAALLDSVGGPVLERLFPLLAPGATVIAYGTASNAPVPVQNSTLVYANLTWKGFGIDRWLTRAGQEKRARMVAELWAAIERGTLPLPVDSRFALADFPLALARVLDGSPSGKVLLH